MLMHVLIFPVWQWFVHQTSWLFSCLFFSQKPPETLAFARCFRDVSSNSSMPLQRSVTSMARIPRTDAAVGHCPFCTENSPDGPISLGTVMARRRTKSRGLWDFIIISAGDSAGLSNLRAKQGALPFCTGSCVHANLACPPWGGSFDGNECRLTRPWWMLHAQQGLAAPSYTACLVCLYRCFHAASPGILWNWLSRTCEEHVQGLLEQANWC